MHALALLLLQLPAPAAQSVDLGQLLAEKADPTTRARLPVAPYRLCTISGSHRPSEGVVESVIAEIDGPGALVRIQAHGAARTMRIRLDGADVSVFSAGADLESPFAEKTEDGWILGLPIPFAKRCRVTADGPDSGTFEIEYRVYPPGTLVESATRALLERARNLPRPSPQGTDTFTFSLSEEIPDGGLTCLDPKNAAGPRAITRIHLRAEATDLALALRCATLRLAFDGETTVECPLGDFFGCAAGPERHENPDFTVATGIDEATGRPGTQVELVCRLVMPYRERFDVSIDARRAGDLHVAGLVRTMPWKWDERSMLLHVARRRTEDLPGPAGRTGEGVFFIDGSGVLVGESVSGVPGGRTSRRSRALDAVPFDSAVTLESIRRLEPTLRGSVAATAYYYSLPGRSNDTSKGRGADGALPRPEKKD